MGPLWPPAGRSAPREAQVSKKKLPSTLQGHPVAGRGEVGDSGWRWRWLGEGGAGLEWLELVETGLLNDG